jgi:hypothetical protein
MEKVGVTVSRNKMKKDKKERKIRTAKIVRPTRIKYSSFALLPKKPARTEDRRKEG